MSALFAVIQLYGSTFLWLVAAVLAARGDWQKAVYFMAFACYLLLVYLVSVKLEEKK